MGCKSFVVVSDTTAGYCGKCNIALQEDRYLSKDLKLTKDEPQTDTRTRKKHKLTKKSKKKKK